MNQSYRPRSRAARTAPGAAPPDHGAGFGNLALAGWLGGPEAEGTPVLDEAAQESDGGTGDLVGPGSDELRRLLGEPPWAREADDYGSMREELRVLDFQTKASVEEPAWYQSSNRKLTHGERFQHTTCAQWPTTLEGYDGVYHIGYIDHFEGVSYYWTVRYTPPKRRPHGMSALQYGAWTFMRGATNVINLFNPMDDVIEGTYGRRMNVFDDDFGVDLSVSDRVLSFLQAGVEVFSAAGLSANGLLGGAKALDQGQKIALALSIAAEGLGEPAIASLEELGVIDAKQAGAGRALLGLTALAGPIASRLGGDAMSLSDLLGSLSALGPLGDDQVRETLGDEAYEEVWPEYKRLRAEYGMETLNLIASALGALGR